MRCNGSQTTSIAVNGEVVAGASGAPATETAGAAFEAILTSLAMNPLTDGLGPMGAFFGDALARAALLRSSDGAA